MKIRFHIHYKTVFGQQIGLSYQINETVSAKVLQMNTADGENWTAELNLKSGKILSYQYFCEEGEKKVFEAEPKRRIELSKGRKLIDIEDQWRAFADKNRLYRSAAFSQVYFKPTAKKSNSKKAAQDKNSIQFILTDPSIALERNLAVVGSSKELGNWTKPKLMKRNEQAEFRVEIPVKEQGQFLEYKFVFCDTKGKEIIEWEAGENRRIQYNFPQSANGQKIISREGFRSAQLKWRAAGVAIPVFSLRSKRSFGIGEFADLKPLIKLSKASALKMIQVLPVNDTIAAKTWVDSYPYAAISVFALNPVYINVEDIAKFKNKSDQTKYNKLRKQLNENEFVDFEAVLSAKFEFFNILFEQEKAKVFATKAFKSFLDKNKEWLTPYAAFCHLRDKYNTPDFNQWSTHSIFDEHQIKKLATKNSKAYDQISFYYFLQYFADKQLKEAKEFGRKEGVVLKGDLPIGIYRYSADAWVAPELYNMNEQAGAPPDDYAVLGQNWGFPTYNWETMAKDDYAWWRKRMKKLAEYFDALRIDHILGFFRIWQIPINQIFGTLGLFNPRLPYSIDELASFGLYGDLSRFSKPIIHKYYLSELFGKGEDWVIENFLQDRGSGTLGFKDEFVDQKAIAKYFEGVKEKKYKALEEAVLKLFTEVLLIEEPGAEGKLYNPRITLNTTYTYGALSSYDRNCFDQIYHDYFFQRHETFWKSQAIAKLPALLAASEMLICGEDLGMIPASVPKVMDDLNIIPLEIQRMSKGAGRFGNPEEYTHFSVCSPSCHDMATIRGWWEEDEERAQAFFTEHWNRAEKAPKECNVDIVKSINAEHLQSNSMLAIFPIQDLVGMIDRIKKQDADSERINRPEKVPHYWRYRFHLNIDELVKDKEFIALVRGMVERSGRG